MKIILGARLRTALWAPRLSPNSLANIVGETVVRFFSSRYCQRPHTCIEFLKNCVYKETNAILSYSITILIHSHRRLVIIQLARGPHLPSSLMRGTSYRTPSPAWLEPWPGRIQSLIAVRRLATRSALYTIHDPRPSWRNG